MNTIKFKCDYCGKECSKYAGHVNRARKLNAGLYCDRKCAGLGRRTNETDEEKRAIKMWYDLFINVSMTEDEKIFDEFSRAVYFQIENRINPQRYKEQRARRMPKHVEYCRQPKYKEYKKGYDEQYRAKKDYGNWWEAAIALKYLDKEIDYRESKRQNKIYNKSTSKRKRAWQNQLKQSARNLQQLTLKTSSGIH